MLKRILYCPVSPLMPLLLLVCLNVPLFAQQIKRIPPISKAVFAFKPIQLDKTHSRVSVVVRAHYISGYGKDLIQSLTISLLSTRKGKPTLLSKTSLNDELDWCDVSLYHHARSGDHLLVITANGGQHDHTQVYYLDPHNFHIRPLFENGVIYGDASDLANGRVVEHSPDQYVYPKPANFKRHDPSTAEYLRCVWTYHPRSHRFTQGPYRIDD